VFTSAEETEETMKLFGVDQMVRQLGNGKFRSDLAVRIRKQAEFFADRFNTAVSMHLNTQAGAGWPSRQTPLSWSRRLYCDAAHRGASA
ncbi:MAG: hypothetical protein ACU0DI_10390, partial [Paracoccaceae bacterium]